MNLYKVNTQSTNIYLRNNNRYTIQINLMTITELYVKLQEVQRVSKLYNESMHKINIYIYIYIYIYISTGLFEMIVRVLTTCHTQYT